jgi:hypothetical protein
MVTWCRSRLARGPRSAGPLRVLREAMWFAWEAPRLPLPTVSLKYPCSYPWSPRAQDVHASSHGRRPRGGFGLEIEHLYPTHLLRREFLAGATPDLPSLVEMLTTRTLAAVVTKEDHLLLPSRANASDSWPDYEADP